MSDALEGIKKYYNEYTLKKKFPSGMTAEILFSGLRNAKDDLYFNVYLDVYHKRKQSANNVLHQTGKDGLGPLIWTKKAILAFEEYILSDKFYCYGRTRNVYIFVGYEDNRRKKVYERGLRNEGYKYGNFLYVENNEPTRGFIKLIKKGVN